MYLMKFKPLAIALTGRWRNLAGFGRILDLTPEQFLTDISDSQGLIEAEADAVEHIECGLAGLRGSVVVKVKKG